jgi:glycosyltransferase involved in cell wall biosynthesis
MKEKPYVSVVVPCFNHVRFLPEALQSVLDQTFSSWECIIVNDGSPDNTSEVARDWETRDSRFRLIEKENGGLSSARNAGIRQSSGELILPLDADDRLHPRFLDATVPIFIEQQKLGHPYTIVATQVESFGEVPLTIEARLPNASTLVCGNSIVCTSLFPKVLWSELKGYDENLKKGFEDWDFWLRCADFGAQFKLVQERLFYYRQHKCSMVTEAYKIQGELLRQIVRKNPDIFMKNIEAAVCNREDRILELNNRLQLLSEEYLRQQRRLSIRLVSKLERWSFRVLSLFFRGKAGDDA